MTCVGQPQIQFVSALSQYRSCTISCSACLPRSCGCTICLSIAQPALTIWVKLAECNDNLGRAFLRSDFVRQPVDLVLHSFVQSHASLGPVLYHLP